VITPGLMRRSALRALQWRPILLQLILLGIAGLVAGFPWLGQFDAIFSHLPDQEQIVARLGSSGLIELVLRLTGPGNMHAQSGTLAAFVLTLLTGVIFAGAILAVAASDELLHSRELLEGAGRYYGRLFRMLLANLIPLGVCGAIAGGVFHWAGKLGERVTTEHEANRASLIAVCVALLCYVLAGVWTDLSRAFFVAQPARRSALFATFAGTWLLLRRPLRALSIGLFFDAVSLLLAGTWMVARQQITQTGWRVLLAFLFAQGALALIAWGRAARLLGLVELARADTLARKKPAGTFEMAPPKTSPPPPDEAETALAQAAVNTFELLPPEATQDAPKPGEVIGELVRIQTIAVVIAEPPPDPAPAPQAEPAPTVAVPIIAAQTISTPVVAFEPPPGQGTGGGA
jgi:hypothetical protein